jgi:HAD superfamily hydrolase (TIGR01549 family)
MKTRARVVFFDLGETLVTQNIEDNLVTKHALEELSGILPKHVPGRRLFEIYQRGFKANHAIRSRHHVEIPVHTWMTELLVAALGKKPSEDLVESAIKIIVMSRAANSVAFKDARPTLDRLAKRRVRLGIISNVSSHEVALQILQHVKLADYFEHVITSAYTGIRKPDPGIFLYALREFGTTPEKAIHVGDSEVHDIWGANPVGITSILVKDVKGPFHTDADYTFRNLEEAAPTLEMLTAP